MNNFNLQFEIDPVINVAKFNAMLSQMKAALGDQGKSISFIDEKSFNDSTKSAKGLGDAIKGGETAAKGLDTELKKINTKAKELKGLDLGNMFTGALQVFGGGALLGGVQGIIGGFTGLVAAGKKSLEAAEFMELGFKQAGLSGKALEEQLAKTGSFATALSNKFAVSAESVREYAQQAAFVGGATGQANENITTLAVGIEKASKGMIDGKSVIKSFTAQLGDPEGEANMGRLTKQFPALATALKGVTDPAEKIKLAMAALQPTFGSLEQMASGPIGSMERLENSISEMKTKIGRGFVEAMAPVLESFGNNLVPIIQGAIKTFGAFFGYVSEHAASLKVLATGIAVIGGALFLANGGWANMVTGLGEYVVSIMTRLLPSLGTIVTANAAAVTANTAVALSFGEIAAMAWAMMVPLLPYIAAVGVLGVAVYALSGGFAQSAESKLKDAEADIKNTESMLKQKEVRQETLLSAQESIAVYEELDKKKNRSTEEEAKYLAALKNISEAYPGVTLKAGDYANNVALLQQAAAGGKIELGDLAKKMDELASKKFKLEFQATELKVDVSKEALQKAVDKGTSSFAITGITGEVEDASKQFADAITKAKTEPALQQAVENYKESVYTGMVGSGMSPEDKGKVIAAIETLAEAQKQALTTNGKITEEVAKRTVENIYKAGGKLDIPMGSIEVAAKKAGVTVEALKVAGAETASTMANEMVKSGGKAEDAYTKVAKSLGLSTDEVKKLVEQLEISKQKTIENISEADNLGDTWSKAAKKATDSMNKGKTNEIALREKIAVLSGDEVLNEEDKATEIARINNNSILSYTKKQEYINAINSTGKLADEDAKQRTKALQIEYDKQHASNVVSNQKIIKDKKAIKYEDDLWAVSTKKNIDTISNARNLAQDAYLKSLDTLKEKQAQYSASLIQDPLARELADMKIKNQKELDAQTEQIRKLESEKKKATDKETKDTISKNIAVQNSIYDNIKLIQARALDDWYKKLAENYDKVAKDSLSKEKELAKTRIELLKIEESTLTGSDSRTANLKRQHDEEIKLINLETTEKTAAILKENKEYEKQAAFMSANIVDFKNKLAYALSVGNSVDVTFYYAQAKAAQASLDNLKNTVIANNGIIVTSNSQAQQKITADNKEYLSASEIIRINSIQNGAEQERALRLFEAQKALDAELILAKGSYNAEMVAYEKYVQAKETADNNYLLSANFYYSALKTMQDAFSMGGVSTADAIATDKQLRESEGQNRKALEDAKSKLKTEEANLTASYKKREITQKEYNDRRRALQDEYHNSEKQGIAKSYGWFQAGEDVKAAATKGFEKIQQDYNSNYIADQNRVKAADARTAANNKKISDAQAKLATGNSVEQMKALADYKAAKDDNLKADEDRNAAIAQGYLDLGVSVGASFGAMLASGMSFYKASALALLGSLKAMIPIYIAKIYAEEIASKSFVGIATASALTLGLTALVSVAESAVNKGWKTGGHTGYGNPNDVAGVVHGQEYVMTASNTRKNLADYAKIHSQDLTIEEHVRRNRPDLQRKLVEEYLQNAKSDNVRQQEILSMLSLEQSYNTNSTIKSMRDEIINLRTELKEINTELVRNTQETKRLKTAISTRINVEFEGELKADSGKIYAEIDNARYKSLRNM